MEPDKLKDESEKRRKAGWLDVWMAFETVAIKSDVVESAIREHIEKLGKSRDALVYEKSFKENIKLKEIPENLKKRIPEGAELWSQVADCRCLVKDMYSLLNIVMVYGPSAIEVLGPKNYNMKIDEIQNVANIVAGLLHEFASAGIGGVVISKAR